MSVIIRLQNLPWSANAADIRHFFYGLSIPEGGVHIVGGQLGDAFIAFSTDEDARQGMVLDGRMLKDSCVKLYLSSRTEMQKIIEETRQQHLALQAASVSAQRSFGNVGQPVPFMTASTSLVATPPLSAGHLPDNIPTQIRPSSNANNHMQQHIESSQAHIRQEFDTDFSQRHVQQQLYNPHIQQLEQLTNVGRDFHRENPHPIPGINVKMDQTSYAPVHQGGQKQFMASHHFRGPSNEFQMGLSVRDDMSRPMNNQGIKINTFEDRIIRMDGRDSAGTPELERNGEIERGGFRNKERIRGNRDRDRERGFRRGRKSRSRSRSGSPRPRRRRSRSSSPERRKGLKDQDKDRDRNGKSNKSLLPTPPVGQPEFRNKTPTEFSQIEDRTGTDSCIQFRLLTGELAYRDIREYFRGIITPSNSIKMINALDGNRFGLAYIRFSSSMDKEKALSRQHGLVRGHQVQMYHVEDSTFDHAIDSYSPGVTLDAKLLSHSCLGLRDFPPTGNPNSVQESFGIISIGQVFPERNEIGTVTGLCYVRLSSEADVRKGLVLLKDGVMICGRQVKIALLPLSELEVCAKNLDRLRDVLISANARTQTDSPVPQMNPLSTKQMIPEASFNNATALPFHAGNGNDSFSAIHRPRSSAMHQVLISGLPPNFMERDVGDFFSDIGVIPQLIEIVYDDNRVSIGSAYCQFCSSEEAERALDKNGDFFDGHTVTVSLVHSPDEPIVPIVNTYKNEDGDHSFNPCERNLSGGRGSIKMHNYNRQSTNTNYNRPADSDMSYQQIGPRHALRGGYGSGTRHHVPMNLRNTGIRNRSGVQSESSSPPPNGFGAPGCVVALSNVHPRALIADILDFFRGFQLDEKCVIRRFGRNGEPTGDARVAFSSPEDAVRAVRNFQNEHMLNRRITLSIV